ncbi:MAG TPA: hypothetical protein VG269_26795 [Tepidisphaeraceae bacterium]|jgi:hypothetical protein|nr:hypothetical protein [Tepidisphaeraceae bacterium]
MHGVQFANDGFGCERVAVTNKTGLTLVPGGIYALDLTKTFATTPGQQLGYLVGVSAGNKAGILVVAETALAAGDQGLAIIEGPVAVEVDGSGTAVVAGDPLKVVVPGTLGNPANLIKNASAIGNADLNVAKALDATAAAASATALKVVYFSGKLINYINNPAVS